MNTSVEKKDEGLITVSHPEQPQQGQIGPILALGNLSTPNGKQISNNYFTFRKSEMYDPTTNGYGSPRITVSLNNGNTEIKDITFSFQCWKGSDLILDSKNGELKDLMGGTSLLEVTYNTSNIWISAFTRFNRNTKSKGTVMNTGSYTGTRILTLPVDSRVDFILELLTYKLDATTEFTCKVDFTSSNPSYSLSTDKFTIFYIVDQVQTPLKSVEDKACEQVMKNPNGCMAANPNFIILGTEDIPPFDVNRDGKIDSLDTLQALCENWYMGVAKGDVSTCRKICGCTG
jgi:hypothetical protein